MSSFNIDIVGSEFEPIIHDLAKSLLGEYSNDCGIVDIAFNNENGS